MASTGSTDSGGGGQQFCMETDLTSNSVQGGTGGVLQDDLQHDSMRERRDHVLDAPNDCSGKINDGTEAAVNAVNIPSGHETVLNWADHIKNMQAIISDRQNEDVQIDKCKSNHLKHLPVMKEAFQAMEKYHSQMKAEIKTMTVHFTEVQKNVAKPIKNGVAKFEKVLQQLILNKQRHVNEAQKMETVFLHELKEVRKQLPKRTRPLTSDEDLPDSRLTIKKVVENNQKGAGAHQIQNGKPTMPKKN